MADQLKNILHFIVGPDATVALPHELQISGRALVPDRIEPDTAGLVLSADATSITAFNPTSAEITANVLAESWHSLERAFGASDVLALNPQPFIPADGRADGNLQGPMFLPGNWTATAIPASADQDLTLPTGQAGILVMRSGSLVGISVQLSGPVTTGMVTATVTKNGVPTGLAVDLGPSDQLGATIQAIDLDTYTALDLIGAHLTTSADFTKADSLDILVCIEAIELP